MRDRQPQLSVNDAYILAIGHFSAERYTEADQLCTGIIQTVPNHIDCNKPTWCYRPKKSTVMIWRLICFNLETAAGSACIVQSIDLSGLSGKIAVTLLVIRFFPDMPSESIGCARCVLLTAVSRFNGQ
jgi:hypothetical protein